MRSLGQRLYEAYSFEADRTSGQTCETFASLPAHTQAFWNRVACAFTSQLSDFGEEWDAMVEACAVAAEAQDRVGREWVRDSLWDQVLRRAGANVRALKRREPVA